MVLQSRSSIRIPYLGQLFKQTSKSRWIQLCLVFAIISAISTIPIMIKVLLNTNEINSHSGLIPDKSTTSNFSDTLVLKGNKIVYENSLFIAFEFWRLWCLTDGIIHLNSLTILASAWLSLFSVIFNILLVFESSKWIIFYNPLKLENMHFQIALTVIFAVLTVPVILSAHKASKVIGWQVYKKIGSSIEMQGKLVYVSIQNGLKRKRIGMYNTVQWFALMLKINTFFEVVLMGCAAIATSLTIYRVIGGTMVVVLTFALIMARVAITKESRWMMCFFLVTQIGLLAINIFILTELLDASQEMQWFAGIAYVVASCVCVVITLFLSIRCLLNFKKGLKPYVYWMPFGSTKDATLDPSSIGPGLVGKTKTHGDMPIDDDDDSGDSFYRSSTDTDDCSPSMLEKNKDHRQIYINKFGYSRVSHTSLDHPEITHPIQAPIHHRLDTVKVIDQRMVPVTSTLPVHEPLPRLTLKPILKSTSAHAVVLPSASSPTYSSIE
ncbi:hypothetical protein A0J61_04150 [Choanephora cucurbitarum]|uniref:Uncharacterized protein n=1 Tax=Choanephora cucurbitarum TaxID=101091 RepID=A0A1C7NFC4_9FUNG|nr:hypothetical protein A0J61_04150 [Choanephora cucurbitarum]